MTVLEYARDNYSKLFRQPQGQLRYPFIVPGATYRMELWDWDSWLTDIALSQITDSDISQQQQGCILNFLDHMNADGRIPISITPDKLLPRVLDLNTNCHKPCLAQHAAFIVKQTGDTAWLAPYFDRLCRFVRSYMIHNRHECGLYFWIDDCAIGVDNDPCTFYRPDRSSGSIFLNCLMYKELQAIVFLAEKLGQDAEEFRQEAAHLLQAVRQHCYDEKDGMYYSVDLNLLPVDPNTWLHSGSPRHWDCLIQRIGCWSGFLAMWSGIATPEQAQRMVRENLLDPNSFWGQYGVRTLSKYEKMYLIKKSGNPSCWLGPVWGISNYLVFRGLLRYGFEAEARTLAEKTVALFQADLDSCGQFHEYYDPDSGAPVNNPGFQSWNLLVANMQTWLDGKEPVTEF